MHIKKTLYQPNQTNYTTKYSPDIFNNEININPVYSQQS